MWADLILSITVIGLFYLIWFFRDNRIKGFDGPKGLPILGNALDLLRLGNVTENTIQYISSLVERFGVRTQFSLGWMTFAVLASPQDVEKVLGSSVHIDKGILYDFIKDWLGNGIVTVSGEKWHRQRKLLTPTFHYEILRQFLPTMSEHSRVLVDSLNQQGDKYFDASPLLTSAALDIICETAMGRKVNAQTDPHCPYGNAVHAFIPKARGILTVKIPNPTRQYSHQFPIPGELSYLSVPSSHPLVYKTVGDVINEAALQFPDNIAIIAPVSNNLEKVSKSFSQLKTEVDTLATGLLSLGLTKGDRIGIWGPNSYEWYLSHAAGMKAGLTVVNINPAFQTHEILYCLNKVGIKTMLIAEKFKTSDYYGMMCEIAPEILRSDPGRIKSQNIPSLTSIVSFQKHSSSFPSGTYSLEEIIHVGSKMSNRMMEEIGKSTNVDDVCNIQFTSGTTGHSKGAMLSNHGIVNNALFTGRRFGFNSTDKLCLPNPLFHCFGSVVGALSAMQHGSTLVLPSPEFSAPKIIQSIQDHRCTIIFGTPTMHISILNELQSLPSPEVAKAAVSSLRLAVTGGAICPEEIFKRIRTTYGIQDVGSVYGMTEVSPVVCQSLPTDDDHLRFTSVGYPLEHTEIKVIDLKGDTVPAGQVGELCIRGFLNMVGYCGDPDKTQETIDTAGWLQTGDLVVLTPTGHTQIVGRIKDMIIRGGENIYPREIEDYLHTLPGVDEVAVVGVPDDLMGEQVAVWIKPKDGAKFTEVTIKDYCRGKIAHYKIPKYVFCTEEFPKTSSGKIKKYLLRDDLIHELQTKETNTLDGLKVTQFQ